MKVTTLLENSACREDLGSAHGLSLYIETKEHKILFDMGPDEQFWDNAEKLGIDLREVDIAVLSHGHYDHGGGTELFLHRNEKAKLYIHKEAFGEYLTLAGNKEKYIGLPESLKEFSSRMVLCEGAQVIDENLLLFSGVEGEKLPSHANDTLHVRRGDKVLRDRFCHEQNLLVQEGDHCVLFAGCAHSGIVNILDAAEALAPCPIKAVFAGFHLYNPSLHASEPKELVTAVGEVLRGKKIERYFTGHCTGEEACLWLEELLGERLGRMSGGGSFSV